MVIAEGSTNQEGIDQANLILDRIGAAGAIVTVNDGQEITFATPTVNVRIEVPMAENSLVFPQLYNGKSIVSEVTLNTERYRGFFDGGVSASTGN